MNEQNPKPKSKLRWAFDKLVMGAIIGGAIGSVLGMAFAPRKGKETRKIIKEKGQELYEKHGDEVKNLAETTTRESRNMFEKIKNKFSQSDNDERKIPTEKP